MLSQNQRAKIDFLGYRRYEARVKDVSTRTTSFVFKSHEVFLLKIFLSYSSKIKQMTLSHFLYVGAEYQLDWTNLFHVFTNENFF